MGRETLSCGRGSRMHTGVGGRGKWGGNAVDRVGIRVLDPMGALPSSCLANINYRAGPQTLLQSRRVAPLQSR